MTDHRYRPEVEILSVTDTGRRRRWTDAEKVRIVEESLGEHVWPRASFGRVIIYCRVRMFRFLTTDAPQLHTPRASIVWGYGAARSAVENRRADQAVVDHDVIAGPRVDCDPDACRA